MEWNIAADSPIYLQLARQMRLGIVSGGFGPGAKLPAVRELAMSAGVNPNTMQRALAELERDGLVYANRTAGRYVTDDAELIARARAELAREQTRTYLAAMRRLACDRDEILGLVEDMSKEE